MNKAGAFKTRCKRDRDSSHVFSIIMALWPQNGSSMTSNITGKITDCEFLALLQYEEGKNNNFVHSLIQANLQWTRNISIDISIFICTVNWGYFEHFLRLNWD